MTILTNSARKEIIESVIKATFIPAEKEAILKSTSAAIRQRLVDSLPDGFLAATENLPREWFSHSANTCINADYSPESILRGGLDLNGNRNQWSYPVIEPLRHPGSHLHSLSSWEGVLAAQIKAATTLRLKEAALRTELSAFLHSCRTYAKVLEGMPELERHLPTPAVKAYPVATSTKPLEKALKGLGFDLGAV